MSLLQDLIGKLQRELEGPFLDGVVAAIMPFPEFYATELHDAMEGLGTNENVLTEVMCTLNNSWIHEINAAYEKREPSSLLLIIIIPLKVWSQFHQLFR